MLSMSSERLPGISSLTLPFPSTDPYYLPQEQHSRLQQQLQLQDSSQSFYPCPAVGQQHEGLSSLLGPTTPTTSPIGVSVTPAPPSTAPASRSRSSSLNTATSPPLHQYHVQDPLLQQDPRRREQLPFPLNALSNPSANSHNSHNLSGTHYQEPPSPHSPSSARPAAYSTNYPERNRTANVGGPTFYRRNLPFTRSDSEDDSNAFYPNRSYPYSHAFVTEKYSSRPGEPIEVHHHHHHYHSPPPTDARQRRSQDVETPTADNNNQKRGRRVSPRTGLRHTCPIGSCGWSFKRHEHLKRHMKTHSGERPFTCEYPGCAKTFGRSDNFAAHIRTHGTPVSRTTNTPSTVSGGAGEEKRRVPDPEDDDVSEAQSSSDTVTSPRSVSEDGSNQNKRGRSEDEDDDSENDQVTSLPAKETLMNEHKRPRSDSTVTSKAVSPDITVSDISDVRQRRSQSPTPPESPLKKFDVQLLPNERLRPPSEVGEGSSTIAVPTIEANVLNDIPEASEPAPPPPPQIREPSQESTQEHQGIEDTPFQTYPTTNAGEETAVQDEQTSAALLLASLRVPRRLSLQTVPLSQQHAYASFAPMPPLLSAAAMQHHQMQLAANARLLQEQHEQHMHHIHNQATIAAVAAAAGEPIVTNSSLPSTLQQSLILPSPYLMPYPGADNGASRPRSHSTPTLPTHPIIPGHHVPPTHPPQDLRHEIANNAAAAAAIAANGTAAGVGAGAAAPVAPPVQSSVSSAYIDADPSKPHVCTQEGCLRRFKRREHLRRHLRTHTSEKPYTCDVCHKCFSRNDNLAQHARTHLYGPSAAAAHAAASAPASTTNAATPPQLPNAQIPIAVAVPSHPYPTDAGASVHPELVAVGGGGNSLLQYQPVTSTGSASVGSNAKPRRKAAAPKSAGKRTAKERKLKEEPMESEAERSVLFPDT